MKPFFEDPDRMLRRLPPGDPTEIPRGRNRPLEARWNGDRPPRRPTTRH